MDTKDYIRVESALAFLSKNRETQPSLAEVAEHGSMRPLGGSARRTPSSVMRRS